MTMEFYRPHPDDPDWLVRTCTFHGHLGPWVTVGAMIGRDAVARLDTPGHWKLEVVCWMPPERQRTPFSCILDGLQATSGATMGKRNLRFDYDPRIVRGDEPVVHVIRKADGDRLAGGLEYRLSEKLAAMMRGVVPDRLETLSREIAALSVDELFDVRALSHADSEVIGDRA
jgi:hypothetical protein